MKKLVLGAFVLCGFSYTAMAGYITLAPGTSADLLVHESTTVYCQGDQSALPPRCLVRRGNNVCSSQYPYYVTLADDQSGTVNGTCYSDDEAAFKAYKQLKSMQVCR